MYRIMLADDEGIVTDSLKFIIEKEFGDMCLVQSAKTGRGAIELAETFSPDIIIMDIMMPGINGIEAMKEIRRTNSKVVLIVMSAYDKFDYAQESIALDVLEYITKPMEKTKIVAILRKAMTIIDGQRMQRTNDLIIKEKLEIVVPIIESGFIYNVLFQEKFYEDIESYKSILDIKDEQGFMIAFVCGDKLEGSHLTNAVGSSVKLQQHYNEIRDEFKKTFNCLVGTIMANKIAVLVPTEKEKMDLDERISIIDKANDMARVLMVKTNQQIRIGIGSIKPMMELRTSYNEALKALTMTTENVIHVEDLPIGLEYESNYPRELEKQLFDEIREGNSEKVAVSSNAYFDWMLQNPSTGIMDMRLKILEFVLWAEKIAYNSGGMKYVFDSRADYLPQIMATEDHEELRRWFLEKMAAATRNVTEKKAEKSTRTIAVAKEYILKNYNNDISLDDVSREVNISPYYFSKLFKDETGEGFVEYLTNLRIEKAKELLSGTSYSMKEICQMVGYTDPNYFSRIFKKNVGVTPTEFKENMT